MILLRECEYSRTWRLRTHKLIKIITGIFSAGTVGCCCTAGTDRHWHCPGQCLQGRQGSHGQANLDFSWANPACQGFIWGVNSIPGQGTWREKCPQWGHRRFVLTGCSPGHYPNWREQVQLREETSGRISVVVAGLFPLRAGQQEKSWVNQPRRSSSSCHTLLWKARLQPEQGSLASHPSPPSPWQLCDGEARGARWGCPATSWLVLKNRGSCWRREIHNLGGFGTILPEVRKENKACVGKLWHISNLRCLEDHSSFLWIYPRSLKIGLVFSATCMFHFYLSALCLGIFLYCILLLLTLSPQIWTFSVSKC